MPDWVYYYEIDWQTVTSTQQDNMLLDKIRSWDYVLVHKRDFKRMIECTRKYGLIEHIFSSK